jgi:hypothetical protein
VADLRTLTLALVADVDKFKKGLDKADGETRSFSDKLKTALKAGAAAFAAIGAAAGAFAIKLGKDAINAASDFNEELSKSQVILGDGADAVAKFASTAAVKLGQSRTEALRAAANFAIFGKSAGLSGQELAKFSTDFVTLASDLASFNNTSPEDAVQALGAALRGESEPIRRYGVLLSAAGLEQAAFNFELRTGQELARGEKNELTDSAKVLARYQAILEQTADAQGDFARTSDGLANSQRILKAEIEDLKISLGENLLPVALNVATFFKEQFVPVLRGVVAAITGKPDSLTTAIDEGRRRLSGFEAQQFLAERQGFRLGQSYKDLGAAIAAVANVFRTEASAQGGFQTGLDVLTAINNKIADIILAFANWFAAIRKVTDALSGVLGFAVTGGATGSPSASDQRLLDLAANQRRPNTQPITVNVRGAIDPQGTARTVTKVLTTQRAISGVRVTAPSGFF